jgi:D-alanyl-D-alanine carboxypeptidase (penicillin-binding protein 5/6)
MLNIKQISAFFAASVIALSATFTAFAKPETETQSQTSAVTSNGIYMEDPNLTPPDTDKAQAALLMDMNSGRLIYGKNTEERLYPASTTKMMTGIIALESGKMNDMTTATYEALQSITLEDSHMGILIGEELSMTDLLNGMLVYSANDASNVIAVHIAGSMDSFVEMMNAKALELGMKNTHFMNPCGVHHDDHYTTAADLAILARYCMQNEQFRQIVKTVNYHIPATNKYHQDRYLPSTNLFLGTARSSHHYYKPCTGIKTGTTEKAGHCLVSSAEYEEMNLLSVVLNCPDEDVNEKAYSYTISRALFNFGFNNYHSGVLATPGNIVADSKVHEAKKDKRVTLTVDADVKALIPANDNGELASSVETVISLPEVLQAPITKGDKLGTVSYIYNGTEIGTSNLIAANDVELNKILHFINKTISIIINPLVFIPVILIIILITAARAKKKRRDRKRRLQQIKQRKELEAEQNYNRNFKTSELNRSHSKGDNSRYSGDRR